MMKIPNKSNTPAVLAAVIMSFTLLAVDAIAVDASSTSSSSSSSSAAASSATAAGASSSSKTSGQILRKSKDYDLLEVAPHDTTLFTQGLTYFNGHLYEGTGLEHQSQILQHDPSNNMKTLHSVPLTPTNLFGEGIAHYYVWKEDDSGSGNSGKKLKKVKEHRLIQLTWKNKVGYIYTLPNLEKIHEFTYDTVTGEGWGITFLPQTNEFYVSDGSEYIMVWDAETLQEKRRMFVTLEREVEVEGQRQTKVWKRNLVNELEFVDFGSGAASLGELGEVEAEDGEECTSEDGTGSETCSNSSTSSASLTPTMRILANIWYQDVIVSIDPTSGKILREYDMRDLYPLQQRRREGADCLNGISVVGSTANSDSDGKGEGLVLWVTGKLWPNMYRIRLTI